MKKIRIIDHAETLVSDEDLDRLSRYKWHLAHGYVVRGVRIAGKGTRSRAMHHEVLPQKPGFVTDHIDRDTLNNQRENLRYATHCQNSRNAFKSKSNTSGYKGVSWLDRDKRWTVWIHIDGQNRYLGSFQDKHEAAYAYNKRAKEAFGEFAWLNPIPHTFVPSAGMTAVPRKDGHLAFRGIKTFNKGKTWHAVTIWGNMKLDVGPFDTPEEAAYIYDQVALQVHGDKARLNLL